MTNNKEQKSEAIAATVLLVADDIDFSRSVKARWQLERQVPDFIVLGSELVSDPIHSGFQTAVVGPVARGQLSKVVRALAPARVPVIVLAADSEAAKSVNGDALIVRQLDGWPDALVVLAGEALRHAAAQAERSKAVNGGSQATESNSLEEHAALGRYMVEMKHSCNNALTSILGNSELLLLEPTLAGEVREQIETIHSMSLRIHEVWQRFSSMQAEMESDRRESQHETRGSIVR